VNLPPLLAGLAGVPVRDREPDGDGRSLVERLAATPPEDRERTVTELVQSHVAAVLGHDGPDVVGPHRPFSELGIGSLSAVELRNQLAARTGLRLPATLVFDHPTPAAVAKHLLGELDIELDTEPRQPALAELDRLESLLSHPAGDEREHEQIADRLRALLDAWTAGRPAHTEELDTVTDDEMFDLLGKEFGIS
jgi:acyl carrier protein